MPGSRETASKETTCSARAAYNSGRTSKSELGSSLNIPNKVLLACGEYNAMRTPPNQEGGSHETNSMLVELGVD